MLNIYCSYPQHIAATVPVEYENFVATTKDLHGAYLDFTVALSSQEDGVVVLDFLPSEAPWQVRVGPDIAEAKCWSPSANESLAKEILSNCAPCTKNPSTFEALRAIVESKYGRAISVPRIKRS